MGGVQFIIFGDVRNGSRCVALLDSVSILRARPCLSEASEFVSTYKASEREGERHDIKMAS